MSQLDTSGGIFTPGTPLFDQATKRPLLVWSDLDPFTQGYVEALLTPRAEPGVFIDAFRFSDLAPETLAAILKDCERFQTDPRAGGEELGAENGKAFWTLRAMGAGTEHGFPPLTPCLGDDGKVYLRLSAA